ncbi:MAG: ADOP family duplicated permease [Acidobacteriota bacterium]
MSQNRWALKLGISSGHLSELVNGKRPYPAPETRQRLCKGLGLSFEELFQLEAPKPAVEQRASSKGRTRKSQPPLRPLLQVRGGRYRLRIDRLPPCAAPGGGQGMQNIFQDFRYGLRWLTRNPAFTAVAVLALALGIGGNSAIFSLVCGVVLNPLNFEDPEELVMVWETVPAQGNSEANAAYPNLQDWMAPGTPFEAAAVLRSLSYTLMQEGRAERIQGARASADFFRVLGVEAFLGRTFQPQEDLPGSPDLAVVSHGFWKNRLGGDPKALGKPLNLDGASFELIGVLPPDFSFPIVVSAAQIWTGVGQDGDFSAERGMHAYKAVARLRPEAPLPQAQHSMDAVAQRLAELYPEAQAGRGIRLVPLHQQVTGNIRPALLVLLAVVGCVLLIACANVANLLLARGASRRRELAVRTALGAGRGRLVRQLVSESLLLAGGGGALGLLMAWAASQHLLSFIPVQIPRLQDVSVNIPVVVFTLAISLLTGVLFGIAPAWQASRLNLQDSLADGGRGASTAEGTRLRRGLVMAEVALALVLLIGAGLLVRSFANLIQVEPGYNPDGVLTFSMSMPLSDERGFSAERADFYARILERVRALPGVLSAGAAIYLPLRGNIQTEVRKPGQQPNPGEELVLQYNSVTPGYFETLGIPVQRGRTFRETDRLGSAGVAVINQTMARLHFPDSDPLGQSIEIDIDLEQPGAPSAFEVVGIVGDVRTQGLEAEVQPQAYLSYRQHTWPFAYFALRTQGDPLLLAGPIREQVAQIDATQPVNRIGTMSQHLSSSVSQRRFAMLALAGFSLLALLLASVGIYGVIAYWVGRRTREIGLRIALGAGRRDVIQLVLRTGLGPVLAGLGVGVAASLLLTRWLSGLLFELSPVDPLTYLAVSSLLMLVAALACYLPARRATRIDPLTALRCE